MSRIAYFRVSTTDQSIEAQRHALGGNFAREFADEGVSGAIPAAQRPGFKVLLDFVREGDEVHVYSVDRLGRDALDVQTTVHRLLGKGVAVVVHGLGKIEHEGVGGIILAVLAQVAGMERRRIAERTAAGRETARAALASTGKTHRGKASLGRPPAADPAAVRAWRATNRASVAETAKHFGLSAATVKRYCAA